MSTTPTAVRESLVALIELLAPTSLIAESFERYAEDLPFADWLEQNPAHCFRRFDLRFAPAPRPPAVVNGHEGRWRYEFALEVGYPRVHYKTATGSVLDIDQVTDEDLRVVLPVLRDYAGASYVAELAEFSRESTENVTTLRIVAVFEMWTVA